MAGFWDRLKKFFIGGEAPGAANARGAPAQAPGAAPAQASAAPAKNPYAANEEILGLSAAEMRERAMKINPYQTAWIGRVDTIPPQSDERTALIDRGLILRGLLTEKQIAEIHTVGDLRKGGTPISISRAKMAAVRRRIWRSP